MGRGFGLIGILLMIAIVGGLIYGAVILNQNAKQKRLEEGDGTIFDAVDKAEDAADAINKRSADVANEL